MVSQSRKRRGAASQRIVADYLRANGWPHATPTGAGEPGADIRNTPDLAIEVKARRELSLAAWLRQAHKNADSDLPVLIVRGDGQGPASIDEWATIFRLDDAVRLLRMVDVLNTAHDALMSRDDVESVGQYISDQLEDLSPRHRQLSIYDVLDSCDHSWPDELVSDAMCNEGCGTTYTEWSQVPA